MDEQEAIDRLKNGDLQGLQTLVDGYYLRASRTAYLILGERGLAEDVAQEFFLRLLRTIHSFNSTRPFEPWFLRCVSNDALKAALRRQRRLAREIPLGKGEGIPDEALSDFTVGPEGQVEADEEQAGLWDALNRLPSRQRAAVVQKYYLGLSEREIAERMNSPLGTVKWLLSAARNGLRATLRANRRDER